MGRAPIEKQDFLTQPERRSEMLKRALIVALAAVAAHAGAAFADNNWAFDDPFWSQGAKQGVEMTTYAASQTTSDSFAKYRLVDGYNN
jgi:hypothetical protein